MTITVFKTWIAGEVLTASDLNSSFVRITTAFPLDNTQLQNSSITINGTATSLGGTAVPPRGYLAGLTLSNDSGTPNTILDISAGMATDSANSVMIPLGAFTKSTGGAWASGSGGNGMGNGLTIANSTCYHVILANNGGTPDIYFDTSATGANRPSAITDTKVRRIGSVRTDASAHIMPFFQYGDDFFWNIPSSTGQALDVNVANLGTRATYTLSFVPTGLRVRGIFNLYGQRGAANAIIHVTDPGQPDYVPAANAFPLETITDAGGGTFGGSVQARIWTNSSAQITARADAVNTSFRVATLGWSDRRGQDD